MPDHEFNEKDLEQYLNSSDNDVSRLYQETDKPVPSAATDNAILAAARKSVGSKPVSVISSPRKWAIPASIAAMLVVTFSIVFVLDPQNDSDEPGMSSEHNHHNKTDLPDDAKDALTREFSEPSKWLDHILDLQKNGDSAAATAEMKAFHAAFPDYVIKGERYNELKTLITE